MPHLIMSRAAVALQASVSHTMEDWRKLLSSVAEKYGISTFASVTTDNAREFTSKRLVDDPRTCVETRLPCFCHSWELGVQTAVSHPYFRGELEQFACLLARIRTDDRRTKLLRENRGKGECVRTLFSLPRAIACT